MNCKSKTVWLFFRYGLDGGCDMYESPEDLSKDLIKSEPTKLDLHDEGDQRVVLECVIKASYKPKMVAAPKYDFVSTETD